MYQSLKIVNEASFKAGRKVDDVEKLIFNFFINTKCKKNVEIVKLAVANVASNLTIEEVKQQKLANDIFQIKEDFKKGNYKHASDHVSDELLNNFCFFGSIKEIIEEVKKFDKAGFDEFIISSPFGKNPTRFIKALKNFVSE